MCIILHASQRTVFETKTTDKYILMDVRAYACVCRNNALARTHALVCTNTRARARIRTPFDPCPLYGSHTF